MKKINWTRFLGAGAIFFLATSTSYAAAVKFAIVPATSGSNIVQLPLNGMATVTYTVTNNLSTKTLTVQPIARIIQVTTSTNNPCQNPFILAHGATCSLTLPLNGSELPLGTNNFGPTVCIGSSQASCATPAPANALQVTIGALSISTPTLILAEQGIFSPTESLSRTLTITNNASYAVSNVNYTGTLPSGTTIFPSTCGNIEAGGTCLLTISPGATPSTEPSKNPTSLTPSVLTIQGNSTNALTADIIVLAYNNFYQQGFVFSIDDTTPTSGSVGIKVAASQDNTSRIINRGIVWGGGTGASTVIVGVKLGSTSPCLGSYDGSCNTSAIVKALSVDLLMSSYAASLCANYQIDSAGNNPCVTDKACYTDWYLPAICEMGPESSTNISHYTNYAANNNMVANLPFLINGCTDPECFSTLNNYFSSTEYDTAGTVAWGQIFPGTAGNSQQGDGKTNNFRVRCARALPL